MRLLTSTSGRSPSNGEAQSFGFARRHGRLAASFYVLAVYLFASVVPANAQQQDPRYVYDGATLQVADDTHSYTKYGRWEVWLYGRGVRIPHYAAGLQYSRWGLMEGGSSESLIKQLRDAQEFEEAYSSFFGPGTWGRHTFFNAVGPIAVSAPAIETKAPALEARYRLDGLRGQMNRLIATARPSLENNKSEGPSSPHREYFDQIREALQQLNKLYSYLARAPDEVHYVSEEIARIRTVVRRAENDLPKITASLPTVKLPTSTTWMFHTEGAGSDGTIQVEVTERGSGVSVQQTWTGGDGSMAGTVTLTTIPFNDIGKVELRGRIEKGDETSTVFVQSGRNLFPETINSPLRNTPKRVLPAVDLTTTRNFVYFTFRNSAEAQDAYAYFLYHQEIGR